jgi:hypothetical protein
MASLFTLFNQDHRPGRAEAQVSRVVRELVEADREETLGFLADEPLRNVQMLSLINDHGMSSPSLRGRWFGYFEDHQLTGVALLGHAILFYIRAGVEESALAEFARAAAEIKVKGHVVFGPRAEVEIFSRRLAQNGRATRQQSDHRLCVATIARLPLHSMQLRRANLTELDPLITAQAEMLREASGVDPRETDPEGFARRTADRIERKRTWVCLRDGKVIFKAEIVSDAADIVYLEGVWTHPEWRNQGVATSCLNELLHRLFRQRKTVALIVSPEEEAACHVYAQVGFVHTDNYLACYLNPAE